MHAERLVYCICVQSLVSTVQAFSLLDRGLTDGQTDATERYTHTNSYTAGVGNYIILIAICKHCHSSLQI